jgi:uncharacterized membrane protein
MKTNYPYHVAVKVNEGKLIKLYRDKKFKSYKNNQYAILEYTNHMIYLSKKFVRNVVTINYVTNPSFFFSKKKYKDVTA